MRRGERLNSRISQAFAPDQTVPTVTSHWAENLREQIIAQPREESDASPKSGTNRSRRRLRRRAGAAVVVALLAVAGTALALVGRDGPPQPLGEGAPTLLLEQLQEPAPEPVPLAHARYMRTRVDIVRTREIARRGNLVAYVGPVLAKVLAKDAPDFEGQGVCVYAFRIDPAGPSGQGSCGPARIASGLVSVALQVRQGSGGPRVRFGLVPDGFVRVGPADHRGSVPVENNVYVLPPALNDSQLVFSREDGSEISVAVGGSDP